MFIFRRKKKQQNLNSRESTYARLLQHENFQACIFHERKKNIQKKKWAHKLMIPDEILVCLKTVSDLLSL